MDNPTCGDHIKLVLTIRDGVVENVRFDGKGCAISMASASMMSEHVCGQSVDKVQALVSSFIAALRGEDTMNPEEFEDLMALEGVKKYPLRVKCATLGWHALEKALEETTAS